MKTVKQAILFVLFVATTSMVAQKKNFSDVPSKVFNAFKNRYAGASLENFKRNKDGYIASFILEDKKCTATFSTDGNWMRTETGIHWNDVPLGARKAYEKSKYANWRIDGLMQVDTPKDGTLYKLEVDNANLMTEMEADKVAELSEDHFIYLDSSGQIVKDERKY